MSQGLLPYRDFAVSYPPLFLYVLYPFYHLGGGSFASIPIVVSDAATSAVIYLIVEARAGRGTALMAGLAYALSPFALYYEGYVWFSSQPMTFFVLLAVYYLVKERAVLSFSVLAVAVLFKQEALFLLPVLVIWFGRRDLRRLLVAVSAFAIIAIVVSLPFLALSAQPYLSLVSYGLLGKWSGPASLAQTTTASICQGLAATSSLCSLGSTTGYQSVTSAIQTTVLLGFSYDLNILSEIVVIPMVLLVIPVLWSLRKQPQFVLLALAFSGAVFVVLFSIVFHPQFKYYYIPVYALLLACAADKKTVAAAVAVPVISMVTPSGAFQEVLPLLAILSVGAILDVRARRVVEPPAIG